MSFFWLQLWHSLDFHGTVVLIGYICLVAALGGTVYAILNLIDGLFVRYSQKRGDRSRR